MACCSDAAPPGIKSEEAVTFKCDEVFLCWSLSEQFKTNACYLLQQILDKADWFQERCDLIETVLLIRTSYITAAQVTTPFIFSLKLQASENTDPQTAWVKLYLHV